MRYWIKLYTEALDDPKMGRLTDRQYRTCMNAYMLAGEIDRDGWIGPTDDVAWRLRIAAEDAAADLAVLEHCGIMVRNEAGEWIVRKFAERQAKPPSDQPEAIKQRVRDHRARQKAADAPVETPSVTPIVTPDCNEDVTPLQPGVTASEKRREEKNINPPPPLAQSPPLDLEWAQAVKAYESEMGLISSSLVEDMRADFDRLRINGRAEWWGLAIRQSVANNVRSWSYMAGILRNCEQQGRPPGSPKPAQERHGGNHNGNGSRQGNERQTGFGISSGSDDATPVELTEEQRQRLRREFARQTAAPAGR